MSIVLVGGLDNYLIEVAKKLVERGVPLGYFLDRYQRPASRQGILASVASIDARQFIDPDRIRHLNKERPSALSKSLAEEFIKAEQVFLAVSDRYTNTLSVLERRRLFRELLDYFYGWIQERAVEAIIFPNVPHAGWNNVLYFVAKHFSIPTIILEATRVSDRVMLWDNYESVRKVPGEFMNNASVEVIRSHIETAVLASLADESSWMTVSEDINKQALAGSTPGGELIALLRALAWGVLRRRRLVNLLYDPHWNLWQAHWRRFLLQRRVRRQRAVYESLSREALPKEPYILFFLNYQPEKTTTPMGGIFDDQLLAVRLLSQALPASLKILVKEHPRQFRAHVDASLFRSSRFYRELAAIGGVSLVSPTASTQTLLHGCQATATVTGSIGWQGLLAGKPTFNFGRSWYAACRSCYIVGSVGDIVNAWQEIQQKDAAGVELDVLKFLAFARSELILGCNGDRYVACSKRSQEELADGLAAALAAKVQTVYRPRAVAVR